MLGSSRVAAQLAASQEGLSSMLGVEIELFLSHACNMSCPSISFNFFTIIIFGEEKNYEMIL
jgi:hypothetical protein